MSDSSQSVDEIRRTLDRMRQDYWRQIEEQDEAPQGKTRDFVLLRLAQEWFGVPCEQAREVLRVPHLVPVPGVDDQIAGIVNVRGHIVAVTDLRALCGLARAENDRNSRLMLVEAPGVTTVLLVDEVRDIRTIKVDDIEESPRHFGRLPAEVFLGRAELAEGLVSLIDVDRLLRCPELIVE